MSTGQKVFVIWNTVLVGVVIGALLYVVRPPQEGWASPALVAEMKKGCSVWANTNYHKGYIDGQLSKDRDPPAPIE